MSHEDSADLCAWAGSRGIEIYQRSKTVWIAAGAYRGRHYVVKGRSAAIALALWMEGARYTGPRPLPLKPGRRFRLTEDPSAPAPRTETPLEMAERHVSLGARNIARQQRIVEDILARGHPPDLAKKILKTFEDVQVEYLAHRTWLLTSPFPPTPAEPRILRLATRLSLLLIKRQLARRATAK